MEMVDNIDFQSIHAAPTYQLRYAVPNNIV